MIRRSARTTLVAAACSAVLATGLAACGTVQQLSAADKVSTAFDKLGRSKSLSAKVSVDATVEQIEAFGAATGAKIDKESASALAAVSLSVAFSADKPLKDVQPSKGAGNGEAPKPDASLSSSVALTGKDGASLVELRQVGERAFARADLAAFGSLFGEDPAELDAFTKDLPAALQGALKGKWIGFDAKDLTETGGPAGAGASPAPTLAPGVEDGLAASLKDILTHDLSFEDKGKQDGKERITVTAPARKVADDLLKAFEPLTKDIPNLGKLPKSAPSDVPDRNLSLDVLLDGGALSAVTFDLAQLDAKAGTATPLPLRIAFAKDAPAVQAPADAATISAEELGSAFGDFATGFTEGLLGSGAEGAGASDGSDGPGGAGAPLTDAQVKELTAGGALNEEQVRLYNKLGMSYQDIKDLAAMGS
ncbi:hypothetical protein [Kitasatospora sp. NPDC015120]|uniref:hypothetical protein n=1 Tax=Kitasatospora sp. NPDC015120 TaxID=3364023 RepID=UPI0036F48DDE